MTNKPLIHPTKKSKALVYYKLTRWFKYNELQSKQPGVVKIKRQWICTEMCIKLHHVEDRGAYWYISFSPTGKDYGRCAFGYARIYKNLKGLPRWNKTRLTQIPWSETN